MLWNAYIRLYAREDNEVIQNSMNILYIRKMKYYN